MHNLYANYVKIFDVCKNISTTWRNGIVFPFYLCVLLLLFLYTYANFLFKNGHLERIREKEQCTLRVYSIRNKRRRLGRTGRETWQQQVGLSAYGCSER